MPLSPPAARTKLHTRRIVIEGYEREDGLFEVEAHLVDTKSFGFDNDSGAHLAAGQPLHDMRVRLTYDARMTILAAEACTDTGPYAGCQGGPAAWQAIVGMRIKAGFLREASARMAGPKSCTHQREMLQEIATTALQTMWPAKARRDRAAAAADPAAMERLREKERGEDRVMIDTCVAYAADGEEVRRRWPDRYTGALESGRAAGAIEPERAG